jgi:hypothetical protein
MVPGLNASDVALYSNTAIPILRCPNPPRPFALHRQHLLWQSLAPSLNGFPRNRLRNTAQSAPPLRCPKLCMHKVPLWRRNL